jgi:uncharacterized iron-regulated membrane protein
VRRVLFWMHLSTGVLVGALILFFSITGALLAYERPIIHAADKRFYQPDPSGPRLPLGEMVARAAQALPASPEMLILHHDPNWPLEIQTADRAVYFVDPHSGRIQGPASPHPRAFFAQVTALHRWFGLANAGHAAATALKGVVVLLFLFLLASGAYLWMPGRWAHHSVRGGIVPRFDARGRARSYNWHKVTGFWFVLPLAILAGTGVIMAYPWANALLFRIAGSPVPVRGERPNQRRPGGERKRALPAHLDQVFALAASDTKDWQTVTLRLPPSPAGLSFTVDRGDGGQPQMREQVFINPKTREIVRREPFAAMSRGQQWRMWVRFTHTGEAGGWWGETLAFLTAWGAVMLAFTGSALSLGRLQRWRRSTNQKRPLEVLRGTNDRDPENSAPRPRDRVSAVRGAAGRLRVHRYVSGGMGQRQELL